MKSSLFKGLIPFELPIEIISLEIFVNLSTVAVWTTLSPSFFSQSRIAVVKLSISLGLMICFLISNVGWKTTLED